MRLVWIVGIALVTVLVAIWAVRTDRTGLAVLIGLAAIVVGFVVLQPARREMYCPACGAVGLARLERKGSGFMNLALLLFFIIPGILYWVWRQTNRAEVCVNCSQRGLIPANSPRAMELRKRS
jgi:hypothetical protein